MAVAEKIELYPVESSNLSRIGYNQDKQIAAVQFKSWEIFHYSGIPLETMEAWLADPSKGGFYGRYVRGRFPGQKMTGHCPACGAMGWVGDTCGDCGCEPYAADKYKDQTEARA